MNSGPLLFLGIFFSLASSFWGLVLVPHLTIGHQQQVIVHATGQPYPVPRPGLAQEGEHVYRANGCAECHTRQVRAFGGDLERGWGVRYSVAQDYLYDYPVMLGKQRVGPDLANIGMRIPNETELLKHLYDPQLVAPGSMMPPFHYLFEKRKLKPGQPPSPDALPGHSQDYQIVPRSEARALVSYLLSQRADVALREAPLPQPQTNITESVSTNIDGTISTTVPSTNVVTNAAPAAPRP